MRGIDSHCHVWRLDRGDYGWLDGTGGPLAPIRRDFSLADHPGASALILVQAAPTAAETDHLLAIARADARVLGVVGWVDLAAPDAAEALAARAADPLFLGIRPMLQDIDDTDWLAGMTGPLAEAARLGLTFDALVTTCHLPMLARVAAAQPDLSIVIDHAAKPGTADRPGWAEGMAALAALPHVHCKLSGLLTELPPGAMDDPLPTLRPIVRHLLDTFGPERLIWGSDWPVLTLAAPYARWEELTDALLADLSGAERAAIMGGNAARFYGVAG